MSKSQLKEAEKAATKAWSELVNAAGSASDAARALANRGHQLADETGSRVSDYTDRVGDYTLEARRRTVAARDALAGRRTPVPWMLLAGAAVLGAIAGWAANVAMRRRATQATAESLTVVDGVDGVEDDLPGIRTNGALHSGAIKRTVGTPQV